MIVDGVGETKLLFLGKKSLLLLDGGTAQQFRRRHVQEQSFGLCLTSRLITKHDALHYNLMTTVELPIRLFRSALTACRRPQTCLSDGQSISRGMPALSSRKTFTTSTRRRNQEPITAAPPISFENNDNRDGQGQNKVQLNRLRLVPASPSYFTGKPDFTDNLLSLQTLLRKYQTLPIVKPGTARRVAWKTLQLYRGATGENVRASRYTRIIEVLNRLNQIRPELVPEEVAETLTMYKRAVDPYANKTIPEVVDEFGRAKGIGRRKTSSAKVWLVEGEGEVLINGRPLNEAFGRIHDRESAIWALKQTERMGKYNIFALVSGGGTTGQAEAMALGVAKALMVHEPMLKPALRRGKKMLIGVILLHCSLVTSSPLTYFSLSVAGVVTRDPRKVERKKPGKLKARKMPAWVKR